jgi:hypothetical protein
MAAPREVFRIEEMAGGRLGLSPNNTRAPPPGDILKELGALRAMISAAAPAQNRRTRGITAARN